MLEPVKPIGTYECYCPHCGLWREHTMYEDTENGLGWRVIQLECVGCEMLWEIWVDRDV